MFSCAANSFRGIPAPMLEQNETATRGAPKEITQPGIELQGLALPARPSIEELAREANDSPEAARLLALKPKLERSIICLLGPPAAGKGTAGKWLSELTGLPHISVGALLRDEVTSSSELGLKLKPLMDSGLLVPSSLVVPVVEKRVAQADCAHGVILDGAPRRLPEADALSSLAEERRKQGISDHFIVVFVDVRFEEALERMRQRAATDTKKRSDDNEATLKTRFAQYNADTVPVIERFRAAGALLEIDGSLPVDERCRNLADGLAEILEGGAGGY